MRQLTHAFDASVRVLECKHCGAPATLEPSDGQFKCGFCGAINVCATRVVASPAAPAQQAMVPDPVPSGSGLRLNPAAARKIEVRLPHPDRIAEVRRAIAQAPPFAPLDIKGYHPPDLQSMSGATNFNRWTHTWLPKLREHWQQVNATQNQIITDPQIQHRVFWLAVRLDKGYTAAGFLAVDDVLKQDALLRRRAVLETAVGHLVSTPYASVLCCRLSSAAAHMNDVISARAWLGACPPDLDWVEVDGELRIAVATIYAKENNPSGIIGILGAEGEEVPFRTDERRVFGDAYRIHAVDVMGQEEAGRRLLRAALRRYGFRHVRGTMNGEGIGAQAKGRMWMEYLRASMTSG